MHPGDMPLADVLAALPPDLCVSCAGRVFARTEPAPSNADRGRRLSPGRVDPSPACPLCEGLPPRVEAWAKLCEEASQGYDFDTFLVGSVLFPEIRRREEALYARLAELWPALRRTVAEGEAPAPAFEPAEYLKAEVNRGIGKRLEARLGRRVDFDRPDLTFQVDTRFDHVRLRAASVYVQGRYRKLDRTLPQTRWPCRFCGGPGCRRCEYRGKTYETSVEELVAAPFLEAAGAQEESFHGMGREDIDARMLGTGRPFVLELKQPRRRRFDCEELASEVGRRSNGRVEALEVAPADPGAPARFKAAEPEKTYRALCHANVLIDPGKLISVMPSLRDLRLDQRTPERVAHRRADRVRPKRIREVRLLSHEQDRFELEIRAEAGTYIKEFVSGDEGRTRPSLTELLGVPVKVEELDVTHVDWKA